MLTAILPILINENEFWSSTIGLEYIDQLIRLCNKLNQISSIYILTDNTFTEYFSRYNKVNIIPNNILSHKESAYEFKDLKKVALKNLFYRSRNDSGLIILDHRHINQSKDKIINSIFEFQRYPDSIIINLTYCHDNPCQFKAFLSFLGCDIINLKDIEDQQKLHSSVSINKTNFSIYYQYIKKINNNLQLIIECDQQDKKIFAQIIPFTNIGPYYSESQDIIINHSTNFFYISNKFSGIILILYYQSTSGEYDTIEMFTPDSNYWELNRVSNTTIINKLTNSIITGRQDFPEAYYFDGSLCIFSNKSLLHNNFSGLHPIIFNSCFVSDFFDYINFKTNACYA